MRRVDGAVHYGKYSIAGIGGARLCVMIVLPMYVNGSSGSNHEKSQSEVDVDRCICEGCGLVRFK